MSDHPTMTNDGSGARDALTRASSRDLPELSVVAPMYNEEPNVEPFIAAVTDVLSRAGIDYEILLVCDGSSDGTWPRIVAAGERNPKVRGLRLARNFGHQEAIFAGLCHARGHAVITMDGDLQHPPDLLPALYHAWRRGSKVVNTRRRESADTTAFKRATSRQFYRLFSWLSGVRMEPGSSDFRLLDHSVVDAIIEMADADLFIRGLVGWLGYEAATVEYQAQVRHAGVPKFTLARMLRFSAGAVTSFSAVPLRLGIAIGLATSGLAFAELVYILVTYARGLTVPGWASVMTVMSFMFGILFILLGITGTYLGKVYEILKKRPRYVVRDRIGFAASDVVPPGVTGRSQPRSADPADAADT